MKLSNKAVTEFIEIYFKQYGVRLSVNEANERGMQLLNFMKLIYKPISKQDFNAYETAKKIK